MIHPDSRTLSWIEQVAKDNKIKDITLVEKTIRAFSLLEALVRSGCPFLFKGGSSLMLHLDTGNVYQSTLILYVLPEQELKIILKSILKNMVLERSN